MESYTIHPLQDVPESVVDFRTQQMIETADIDNHIQFIQELVGKYRFPEEERQQIHREVQRILEKQQERRLHMAVVGEFSSGKSSFINALLRKNLLETDVIQGTTVASTLLTYGETPSLCLHTSSGVQVPVENVEQQGGLGALLQSYTSGERQEEGVQYLEVGYPSDFLQQGICIIDTPGTNSLEQWHEEVTKRTIREQADACIILTSGEKPLPQTFSRFLEENLQDVLPSCIFVVTKIDLIPTKQQARQMEYIRRKIQEELDIANPLVLPYSALPVMNGQGQEYLSVNGETEGELLRFLREQRIKIQLQRCVSLLEQTMGHLRESMEQISKEQKEKHEQLVQAVTTDLQGFVLGQKTEINHLFQEDAPVKMGEFRDALNGWVSKEKAQVYEEFYKPKTESEIRVFLNGKLKQLLEEKKQLVLQESGMKQGGSQYFQNVVQELGQKYCTCFEENFKREYQQLALLAHDLVNDIDMTVHLNESLMINVQANISLQQKVLANGKREDRRILGGAGAGAAAGAAIGSVVPVIGTGAGAVIGAIAGFVRSYKKSEDTTRGDSFRSQVTGDVRVMVEQYFGSLQDSMMQAFNQGLNHCWIQIDQIMNQYLDRYLFAVQEMQRRDQQEQERVFQELQNIQYDLDHTQWQMEQIQLAKASISRL